MGVTLRPQAPVGSGWSDVEGAAGGELAPVRRSVPAGRRAGVRGSLGNLCSAGVRYPSGLGAAPGGIGGSVLRLNGRSPDRSLAALYRSIWATSRSHAATAMRRTESPRFAAASSRSADSSDSCARASARAASSSPH
jgi:hypothetical protein